MEDGEEDPDLENGSANLRSMNRQINRIRDCSRTGRTMINKKWTKLIKGLIKSTQHKSKGQSNLQTVVCSTLSMQLKDTK